MLEFIKERGVTVMPPRSASGTGYHKPTAYGSSGEQSEWLFGKTPSKCNEENLAKAKILTALEDLAGRPKGATGNQKTKLMNDAHRWFFQPSDFGDWCEMAGYDPEFVRERAKEIYEHGMPQWRAAAGHGKRYAERKAYNERKRKRK